MSTAGCGATRPAARCGPTPSLRWHSRGSDPDAAMRDVERALRAKGAPCRFTVSEVSAPGDLDARLAGLGYERGEPTT